MPRSPRPPATTRIRSRLHGAKRSRCSGASRRVMGEVLEGLRRQFSCPLQTAEQPPGYPLDETCFQAHALDFVGDKQWFQFGSK